ncbi:MAG: metallophosphoesterase [Thermoplasmata archaeon]|nr:metallophosphoesterase [Thermoplasmata archaeon]
MPSLPSSVLRKVKEIMWKEPPLISLRGKIMVVGDTHGDVVISKEVVRRFFDKNLDFLIFLGDYVDREPEGVDEFANINFLLEMKMAHPDKIFLLQGNHEAYHTIPFHSNFVQAAGEKYKEYESVFREMPLAAMANNVFLSHAGFPLGEYEINKKNMRAIEDITWNDLDLSHVYRGVGKKFGEEDIKKFLERMDAVAMIRGHDYHFNGIVAYEKCLTIFTSRLYANEGNKGILVAEINGNVEGIDDIMLNDFSGGEWREYRPRYLR